MTAALATISGVRAYIDENGTAQLHIEDIARGLGFTQQKSGVEYIRWETVKRYLDELGFSQLVGKESFIPESVFYRLAMKANNDTAVAFQELVANEILPTIRRTGSYHANIPRTYPEALRLAADLAEENERLKPKAEMHDLFLTAKNSQSMGVVAKTLGIGRNTLFKILREQKILMKNNVPYQEYIDRGYFEVIERPIPMGDATINKPKTLVTAKGVDYIGKLLKRKEFVA